MINEFRPLVMYMFFGMAILAIGIVCVLCYDIGLTSQRNELAVGLWIGQIGIAIIVLPVFVVACLWIWDRLRSSGPK